MREQEKTNIEILNEIRDSRNNEINQAGDTSIRVTLVEVLGEIENNEKRLYRLIEEHDSEDGTSIYKKFYEFDGEKIKLLASRYPGMDELVVEQEGSVDEMTAIKEEIEQCLEERSRRLEAIARKLGIDEQDISSLSQIELEQKIAEKEPNNEQEEQEELTDEQVNKLGIKGMNEINLQAQVDSKGTTLAKTLNLTEYTQIIVVHSYKLAEVSNKEGQKGKINNMTFGLVAKRADGTYETIPETKLRPYRGQNTEVTKIRNEDEVETERENCAFEVPGTNKRLVIDQTDPYGTPEVYLSQATRDNEGNVAQRLQDRYDGTERTDVEVRELFNKNRGKNNIDKMQEEAKSHEEHGCEYTELENVDGDYTTGHQHVISVDSVLEYQGQLMPIEQIASLRRFNCSPETFVESYNRFAKEQEGKKDFDLEEIYNQIEDEQNELIQGGEPQRR